MIIRLGYNKGITITTTSNGSRSFNQHILSVSKSEMGGTYNPIIFVFVYLYFIDFEYKTILSLKTKIST